MNEQNLFCDNELRPITGAAPCKRSVTWDSWNFQVLNAAAEYRAGARDSGYFADDYDNRMTAFEEFSLSHP